MELHFYRSLPSTNTAAVQAAREGAPEFYTVVAEQQTQGRGRMERSFFSPDGGTYFSTVLRPPFPMHLYGQITPIAAVAVHRALYNVTGVTTSIKWVNDLLLDGKKICGILAESGTDINGQAFVVVGIGINTADVDFPPELWDTASFLPCADRMQLIGAILAELSPYREMVDKGLWLAHYREHCAFLDKDIIVLDNGRMRRGLALDIRADGALLVNFGNGVEALRGGEISLRAAQNDANRHNL